MAKAFAHEGASVFLTGRTIKKLEACLLTTGIPETPLIDEVWEIHGKAHGITMEQFHSFMESRTHRKRLTTLEELTNAAIFIASGEGSAISGTILNLTAGMIVH